MKKNTWLANGAVVFVVVACVRLGFWQLSRFEERSAIANERVERHELPPLQAIEPPFVDLDYRRIQLKGHYTKALVATGGVRYSLNGYAALGVFENEADHSRVLVLRGWIPSTQWTEYLKAPKGTVTIEGILQSIPPNTSGVEPFFDEREQATLWPLRRERMLRFFSRGAGIAYQSIADAEQVNLPAVVILGPELEDLEQRNTNSLPAGGYTTYLKVFHHLEYALQWFSFAIIAVGLRLWFGWWRRAS